MTGDLVPLGALAAAQGGVLLVEQAMASGWPSQRLARRLRADGWQRIHRGAWAEPRREATTGLRLRAVQLAHPELAVSHRSAAALHDIELLADGIELSGPDAPRSSLHGVRLHRMPLGADEVTSVDRMRVTTVPRTLADLLRAGPRDEALVAVESALTRRPSRKNPLARRYALTTQPAISAALERAPRGTRGTPAVRRWLALADPKAGSPAETVARLRMYDAGLRPESQAEPTGPNGRRIFPDFLFRAEGLVVETEGYRWHGTREAHQRDTVRFNDLAGCPEVRRILRFTAVDVFHRGGRMIRGIQDALAAV